LSNAANKYPDRSLSPGEVGELICRGPNVMQGYHRNPEGTREALRDGWLYTGDLATMDKEGFFYIVDRKKDMITNLSYQFENFPCLLR